jgi:hypothetical protein
MRPTNGKRQAAPFVAASIIVPQLIGACEDMQSRIDIGSETQMS